LGSKTAGGKAQMNSLSVHVDRRVLFSTLLRLASNCWAGKQAGARKYCKDDCVCPSVGPIGSDSAKKDGMTSNRQHEASPTTQTGPKLYDKDADLTGLGAVATSTGVRASDPRGCARHRVSGLGCIAVLSSALHAMTAGGAHDVMLASCLASAMVMKRRRRHHRRRHSSKTQKVGKAEDPTSCSKEGA
jgi:hypothetical protein